MNEFDEFNDIETSLDNLDDRLGETSALTGAFSQDLANLKSALAGTSQDVSALSGGLSRGLRKAFDGLAFEGLKLSDALNVVAQSAINATYRAAVDPVADQLGGVLAQGLTSAVGAILPFAKGGVFSQGHVIPFANGGVVSGPVTFPMQNGTGLMGEAGPEAILPLSRGADGRLGVSSSRQSQPVSVVMNITTPDAQSFRQSQSQISANLARALAAGQRNT